MGFVYMALLSGIPMWHKTVSFTGFCFGDYGFGFIHKRKLTELEIQEFNNFFNQEDESYDEE